MVDRYDIDPGFECGGLDAKGDYVKYEDYKQLLADMRLLIPHVRCHPWCPTGTHCDTCTAHWINIRNQTSYYHI